MIEMEWTTLKKNEKTETKQDNGFKLNFQFKESSISNKSIHTIYGQKGDGKTVLAFSFPGKIAALCFDRKSQIIKKHFYKNDERIKVYDVIEYLSEDKDLYTASALTTYNYIKFLLENISKEKPDWIVIDGLEILANISEMVMRYNNKLTPFQGIVNRNVWKERRLIMRNIHKLALDASTKGVIYTTYTDKDEIVEEGTIKSKQTIPKWTDVVLWETDFVLHTFSKANKDGRRFYCDIISSKNDEQLKTGKLIDMTDKKNIFD